MALPRSRSFLGIAKESSRPAAGGTPTAAAATDFIPFTSLSPVDNVKYLDDKGIRGSMTEEYDVIQGNKYSEIDFGGDVFPDNIPFIFSGVLGDSVTSGAAAPYTHTFALLNSQASNGQPATFTLSDYYAGGAGSTRQYAGAQFASIDLKFSADAMLTYSAKAMAFASATATNPTPSFSSIPPLPSWLGTVTLAGSSTAILADGNVNISRSVEPIFTVDNTQDPYQLFAGPLTVSGSMKLVYESDTQLQYYLSNTKPSCVVDFSSGAGASLVQVQITMTKCAFTMAKIDRSKDYIELDVTYKALANTTDVGASSGYSPIKVVVKNAVSNAGGAKW